MKVGILSFHASHNYGSMLQNWALQRFLSKSGISCETINLRTEKQRHIYYFPIKYSSKRYIYNAFMHPVKFLQIIAKWIKFELFLKQNIILTEKEYHDWAEIMDDLDQFGYDAIICGGDQIWNMTCADWDISYLLPSKKERIKKISFSPSFGPDSSLILGDEHFRETICRYLYDFEHISVRDSGSNIILEKLLGKKVSVMPDPTLLLESADYEILIIKRIVSSKYVFFYSPFPKREAEDLASRIADKEGKTLVSSTTRFPSQILNKSDTIRYNLNSGPKEFLNFVKHADFVCGQSYHLLVFALMFHKEFVIFNGQFDERIQTLLNMCSLEDRVISIDNPVFKTYRPIDFDNVDAVLQQLRIQGSEFLCSALSHIC